MRKTKFCFGLMLVSAFVAVGAQAQSTVNAKSAPPPPPLTAPTASFTQVASAFQVIEEPYALAEALVRELRKGGYALYMRHGPIQPGTRDRRTGADWWKKCETTERLGAGALPQAQVVGQALARQLIQIESVTASEFCRAKDAASFIGLAAPTSTAALNDVSAPNSLGARRTPKQIAEDVELLLRQTPAAGKNRILVGHQLPANDLLPSLVTLGESHTAIFKAVTDGRVHHVATLSPGQWEWITKQVYAEPARGGPSVPAASLTPVGNPAPTIIAATPPPAPPPPPVIDPAKELKGAALLVALRKGGFNLYMRHGQATVGADTDLLKVPMWWDNCMIQRNISDLGREQSRKVGAAVKELKIPVATVKASQFCRVRDTAELMALGKVEVTEELNHFLGQRAGTDINVTRFKLLTTPPPKAQNVFLVSHTHSSPRKEEQVMGGIQEAEVIVYRPDGMGNVDPIARIPVAEWDNLLAVATLAKTLK